MSKPRDLLETDASPLWEPQRDSRVTARPAAHETGRRDRFESLALARAAAAAQGTLEAPASDEILHTVLELHRIVTVQMQDATIAGLYLDALGALLPRRRFALRVWPIGGGAPALLAARGKVDPARIGTLLLSRDAIERHDVGEEEIVRLDAGVVDDYEPLFAPPGHGFDVPLSIGAQLGGVLSVEYEPDLDEPSFDRSIVVPLTVQLGASLRNARLHREADAMRDNLARLLDHATSPVVVIHRSREVRMVNRALLAATNADRDLVLGRDFVSVLPQSEQDRLERVFLRSLAGEGASNLEVRLHRQGGGVARLQFDTAPVRGADGEVEAVICIGRDLTELHQLEEQVIHAEKLATLGQLAAGVVHELNNPLTSISVYGEYLLRKGERAGYDASDLEKLRRIVESADRILRFTRDLVTYARPSTEEPTQVSLRDVVQQSLLFCEHVVDEAQVAVTTRLEADAVVRGVKGQLHQVFINLITNACHAVAGKEGARIVLSVEQQGDLVRARVEDNGIGIPERTRDKIFEPFFSTKGEGKGTGLGLSIVRNILQQHGGDIRVLGPEAGGTIFEVELPACP